MKKRWIVGGVLAVLLGVSATGIVVNSQWLGGRWDVSHAAADLASKLQKLDGVASATANYDPFGFPDPTMTADVIFASHASPAQWGAATDLVRSVASSRALRATESIITFHDAGSKAALTVEPTLFTPAVISREIAAWHGLRDTVGDRVSLHLGDSSQASGTLAREYSVQDQADARKIAALWPDAPPDVDPTVSTRWDGPGLQISGMPTKAMMTTLSGLGAVLPLASAHADAKQTGTFAVILGSLNGYKVTLLSLRNGRAAPGKPNELMARAAQGAFSTGANEVEWESSDGFRSLVSVDCASYTSGTQKVQTTLHRSARDDAFAAALAGLGFVQPADVRAGACQ